jgi:hypothetical protein
MVWLGGAEVRGQGKDFFLEKKKQKTFPWLSQIFPETYAPETKVFWFFFSKKNCLPSL